AVPVRRKRDSRDGRRTGYVEDGRPVEEDQHHLLLHAGGHDRDCRISAVCGLLFKGCDSVWSIQLRTRWEGFVRRGTAGRDLHFVLYVPADFPDVLQPG